MLVRIPALFLLAALASCGKGTEPTELTNRGSEALRSGDYESAVESFDQALGAIDPSHPMWQRAKIGAIEARTHTDPARAVAEFLEYAGANPSKATDRDFSLIGGRLGEAGKLEEAIAVLTKGMEAFPESPHLKVLMERLGDMARTSGSSEALEALKGLGYVGD